MKIAQILSWLIGISSLCLVIGIAGCATRAPSAAPAAYEPAQDDALQAIEDARSIIAGALAPCDDIGNAQSLLDEAREALITDNYSSAIFKANSAGQLASTRIADCARKLALQAEIHPVAAGHGSKPKAGSGQAVVALRQPKGSDTQTPVDDATQDYQTIQHYEDELRNAVYAWNAPSEMGYCEKATVTLVLEDATRATVSDALQELHKMSAENSASGMANGKPATAVTQEGTGTIQYANDMTVTLSSPDKDFEINALVPESQTISSEKKAQWQWEIIPTHFGPSTLTILLTTTSVPTPKHDPYVLDRETKTIKVIVTSGGLTCRTGRVLVQYWPPIVGVIFTAILIPWGTKRVARWLKRRSAAN